MTSSLLPCTTKTGVQRRKAGKRGCRLARRAWRGANRDIPVPALPPDRRRAGPRPAPAALRHRGGLVGLRGALACSQRCGCACTVGVARTCRKAPAAPAAGAAPELSGECGARQRRAVDVGRGTRRVAGLAGCAGRLARCAQLVAITLHLSRSVLLEPELLMRPRAPGAMQPTLFFSSAGRHQPVSCLVGGASHLVSFYEQLKQPRLAVQPGHPVCRRKGSLCRARLAGTRRLLSWHSS